MGVFAQVLSSLGYIKFGYFDILKICYNTRKSVFYFKCFLLLTQVIGNILSAQVHCQLAESNVEKWMDFNEKLQNQTSGEIPPPFELVETLALKYLNESCTILDVGCETGKNAACLIKNGHKVVLLDIAPNAIYYTMENLKREGLDHGILDGVISKIEDLPPEYGPFKAVIGTYAFSFIPPHLFEQAMKEKTFLTELNIMVTL